MRKGEMQTKLRQRMTQALVELNGWYCHYCLIPLVPRGQEADHCEQITGYMERYHQTRPVFLGNSYTWWLLPEGMGEPPLDHIIPLSQGGTHDLDNLVLACKSCNSRRHCRIDYADFYEMTAPLRAARQQGLDR
jgi:5-methylcytosine-specific restriction endonuclease McrA